MLAHQIADAAPWPRKRPCALRCLDGWGIHMRAFDGALRGIDAPRIIEVGAWLGRTSDALLRRWPRATLVSIDLWDASGFWQERLAGLRTEGAIDDTATPLTQYMTNVWEHRDRVTCVQAPSHVGMHRCRDVRPHLVYIDADHSYEAVRRDISAALNCFPGAVICGDDYEDRTDGGTGVKRAVHETAGHRGYRVVTIGRWWRYA